MGLTKTDGMNAEISLTQTNQLCALTCAEVFEPFEDYVKKTRGRIPVTTSGKWILTSVFDFTYLFIQLRTKALP